MKLLSKLFPQTIIFCFITLFICFPTHYTGANVQYGTQQEIAKPTTDFTRETPKSKVKYRRFFKKKRSKHRISKAHKAQGSSPGRFDVVLASGGLLFLHLGILAFSNVSLAYLLFIPLTGFPWGVFLLLLGIAGFCFGWLRIRSKNEKKGYIEGESFQRRRGVLGLFISALTFLNSLYMLLTLLSIGAAAASLWGAMVVLLSMAMLGSLLGIINSVKTIDSSYTLGEDSPRKWSKSFKYTALAIVGVLLGMGLLLSTVFALKLGGILLFIGLGSAFYTMINW